MADRCSDLCDECRKSPNDISTCCQAESACHGKCKGAEDKCDFLKGVGGNGDNYDNNQYFAAFNERQVRQEIREEVNRAIWNYQQNFHNPQQARVGFWQVL